jgi:hypothetical protein
MLRRLCLTVSAATHAPSLRHGRATHVLRVSVWAATRGGAPQGHWWGHGGRGGWCRRVVSPQLLGRMRCDVDHAAACAAGVPRWACSSPCWAGSSPSGGVALPVPRGAHLLGASPGARAAHLRPPRGGAALRSGPTPTAAGCRVSCGGPSPHWRASNARAPCRALRASPGETRLSLPWRDKRAQRPCRSTRPTGATTLPGVGPLARRLRHSRCR